MAAASDDWRRTSPGAPAGTHFRWREYFAPKPEWDHDHCLFCWAKFVPCSEEGKDWLAQDQHTIYFEGYATVEASGSGYEWVCWPCFDDFVDEYQFAVDPDPGPHRVAILVREDLAADLEPLARGRHVWAIKTPDTEEIARRIWGKPYPTNGDPIVAGVTLFTPSDNPEQSLLAVLSDVELHHGATGHDPPVSILEVIGTDFTDAIREALAALGFTHRSTSERGFVAIRVPG